MVHATDVDPETWAVMGGRPAPTAGAPLNVLPVGATVALADDCHQGVAGVVAARAETGGRQ